MTEETDLEKEIGRLYILAIILHGRAKETVAMTKNLVDRLLDVEKLLKEKES